ncbi:hypothetical protein F5Y01DRAFT_130245 [Xylaria sp. FL0043]|nr:hypothetical protein F5Y01DRAFT_130245 [Xylaria sp. FL0043]
MATATVIPTPFRSNNNIERQDCSHGAFYKCGSFKGCCGIDPCAFLDFDNPCEAAQEEGGDGSDDGEDTSTVEEPTKTTSAPKSSTRDPKTSTTTDDPDTSSTTDPASSTSSSSSSADHSLPSSSAEASTTTEGGTTLSTSVISTPGSSTAGPTTSTLPTPLPTAPSQGDDSSGSGLSKSTLVGVSIAGVAGVLVLLAALIWCVRRRRLAKRMSSLRGSSPAPSLSPSMVFDFGPGRRGNDHDPTGTALGFQGDSGGGVGASAPAASNTHTSYDHLQHHQQQPPALEPIHAELDSAETQLLSPNSNIQRTQSAHTPDIEMTSPLPSQPSLPTVQIHPPQLTPGFGSAHMAPTYSDCGDDANGQIQRDTRCSSRIEPRATLNATEAERVNHQYANSWAYGP